ncbi:hypothetical protein [Hymenobacter sp. B81]|uniref:hypothetical protein n=1 Tax=Hymenobacter sp. B81 TaxID=3344878 RepID=UPI0037DDB37B
MPQRLLLPLFTALLSLNAFTTPPAADDLATLGDEFDNAAPGQGLLQQYVHPARA